MLTWHQKANYAKQVMSTSLTKKPKTILLLDFIYSLISFQQHGLLKIIKRQNGLFHFIYLKIFFCRQGFDSHILRYSARLLLDGKIDAKRKFVITYFLSDDTILVTLVPEQNSGNTELILYMRHKFWGYSKQLNIFCKNLTFCNLPIIETFF